MSNVIEQIKAAYAQEQQNPSPPRKAGDLPLSYEAISDEWLSNVICQNHPGAKVISHRLDVADEGNTSRRRIFIEYNAEGQAAALPETVFCKASHHLSTRISVGISGGIAGEVNFFNQIRSLLNIEAPLCVWANYDPVSLNSIVMLRDLGSATEFCTLATEMTESRLREQMSLLATFHGYFYRRADAAKVLADFPTWPEFFTRTLAIGLEQLCANGFQAGCEVIPTELFARASEVWPATLASVHCHNNLPHTLLHADVHLRNWYVSSEGKMGLNDWQCASKGHWSRDVAYTLATAMDIATRRRLEQDLLRYYIEKLHAAGGPVMSFDSAWRHYRQQLFSALAWWTVTLTPSTDMPDMQPRDATLEMIRRISHAIDDLDALDSFA